MLKMTKIQHKIIVIRARKCNGDGAMDMDIFCVEEESKRECVLRDNVKKYKCFREVLVCKGHPCRHLKMSRLYIAHIILLTNTISIIIHLIPLFN